MRVRAILLAVVLALAPISARAADLVVWWEEGFYPKESQAVREIIAAFEQETGKTVELVLYPQNELPAKVLAAIEIGRPPDFLYGSRTSPYNGEWAYEGRLVDLSDTLAPLAGLFFPDVLDRATLLDATAGRRSLYGLPMGNSTNHLHVWKSLLERAGFTLADIPQQWEPFWSFWCDKVQPAVRRATGREDLWGVGLAMTPSANDTENQFRQFVQAYEANYVTRDGRLVLDEPLVRDRLVAVLRAYTAIGAKAVPHPARSTGTAAAITRRSSPSRW